MYSRYFLIPNILFVFNKLLLQYQLHLSTIIVAFWYMVSQFCSRMLILNGLVKEKRIRIYYIDNIVKIFMQI